jgi:carbamoyl-phosphate synthase large subunit
VSCNEAVDAANTIGYPVMVRPSYVLGGRAMEIVYDEESIRNYMTRAVKASPDRPVLVDRYLEDAVEIDVDAISDGKLVVVAGIMEHIEEAGVHSGDSACSLPPFSLPPDIIKEIVKQTKALALDLGVVGLMNIQYAVKDGLIYVLEVNPRASRTVPFVSKAIGVPLAKLAARVMGGKSLAELGFTKEVTIKHIAVKEAVFPFAKFPGVDTLLGPEMKSTGSHGDRRHFVSSPSPRSPRGAPCRCRQGLHQRKTRTNRRRTKWPPAWNVPGSPWWPRAARRSISRSGALPSRP